VASDYRVSFGGDIDYVGAVQQTSYDLEPYASFNVRLPAYTLVNLRTSVAWRNYQLQVYANNVFDRNAQLNVLNDVDDPYNILTNRPRTLGLRISARF
jgi:outer membrane receptor protein involved in Fe transport